MSKLVLIFPLSVSKGGEYIELLQRLASTVSLNRHSVNLRNYASRVTLNFCIIRPLSISCVDFSPLRKRCGGENFLLKKEILKPKHESKDPLTI